MESEITRLLGQFESGHLNRRQLVAGLGTLVSVLAATGEAQTAEQPSTFEAVDLNHIALRVTNVPRSRDFYQRHLGLKVVRQEGERNCFMSMGGNFVALFGSDEARMDHYCYSVKNYNVNQAEKKLKEHGLEPRVARDAGRIYFKDPDGLTVQLAASDHQP